MGRRLALLLTAVIIAAAGTTLVFLYVKRADDRALADQSPIQVLVAKNTIPAGTSMRQAQTQGDLEERVVAQSSAVDEPLSSIARYRDLVTLTTIMSGQQLSANMLGAQPLTTAALPIEEGDIAASFQLTDSGRVAGFVQPGSHVVVFATMDGGEGEAAVVLLDDAQVLAVGPSTAVSSQQESGSTNAEELPRALVTLSLTELEAAMLIYESENGTLYLGLRNEGSNVQAGTVFPQDNLSG